MDLLSSSLMSTMSEASSKAGMSSSVSARLKAVLQLSKELFMSRLSNSMRSGLNLAMMAQKARPDLQALVKSVMSTPGYPEVTWRHHCCKAATPVWSIATWGKLRPVESWEVWRGVGSLTVAPRLKAARAGQWWTLTGCSASGYVQITLRRFGGWRTTDSGHTGFYEDIFSFIQSLQ